MSTDRVDLTGARLLGIDLGEVRIGIAATDQYGAIRGLPTLRRAASPDADATRLAVIATEQRATHLVVGLPLHADGAWSDQASRTVAWAESAAAATGLPLIYVDERYSSERAIATLGSAPRASGGGAPGPRRREARRAAIDRAAAQLILEDAARPELCMTADAARRAAHASDLARR
jgi:putative Holliday junction resolvase